MTFDPDNFVPPAANIKVFGIGGGGGNAVNTMIRTNIEGVEFIAANTDVQALRFSLAENKIQIGKELTKGLGAGADPDIGRDAMLEDRHAIAESIQGSNMVFITAGMGGGTGTGGAAIAAQVAREQGALTVGVVTKPFAFEGKRRAKHADEGIARLKEHVDTLITIPNQRLLQIASPDLSMIDAFRLADNVLVNAVKGISDIINIPGTVNVDFADVKTVMSSMGMALMGIGESEGANRASEAAKRAIQSPLLEDVDIEGATGILINITAGENVSLMEVNEACSIIQEAAHDDANIIFGAVIDENIGNLMRVTVIATGFPIGDELGESFRKPPIQTIQEPAKQVQATPSKLEEKMTDLTLKQTPLFDEEPIEFMDAEEKEESLAEPENESVPEKMEQDSVPPRLQGATSHGDIDSTAKNDDSSQDEMDQKIDAALKIAEKLSRANTNAKEEEEIEVPSFLRKDASDMSLS